jgi:hypothetical protein
MSGNGEYHFGLLKNAVGTGAQPMNINEGMIFGGIFMEILRVELSACSNLMLAQRNGGKRASQVELKYNMGKLIN